MSSYVEKSFNSREDLPEICEETLETINRLDNIAKRVHKVIDNNVIEARSKQMVTKRKLSEIESMRNIAESLCEKKAQLAVLSYDLIDDSIRQLDAEIKIVEKSMINNGDEILKKAKVSTSSGGETNGNTNFNIAGDIESELPKGIDPNEPVYCLCRQIAFGDMIACDNEDCLIEWFHYPCVGLIKQPKSTWLCPDCTYKKKHG
jgi:inhibitor of growth protein 4